MMAKKSQHKARKHPIFVSLAMQNHLVFRPEPPGDQGRLELPVVNIKVEVKASELKTFFKGLSAGALTKVDVEAVLKEAASEYQLLCPPDLERNLYEACTAPLEPTPFGDIHISHHLEKMSLESVRIIDRAQKALLKVKPFSEVRFLFSDKAKIALRLGWEAMAKHGRFPLPPKGPDRLKKLHEQPSGMMHFVSASDGDAGYFYTMGIALSPEAQSLQKMDLSYGLDGELIVPGQAVAPIPPTLALSTRLFAASIPTSSNISEEIQSIPFSGFAHPEIMDIVPARGYIFRPKPSQGTMINQIKQARKELRDQLDRYKEFVDRVPAVDRAFLPDVGGAINVSNFEEKEMIPFVRSVLEGMSRSEKRSTALFLILQEQGRVKETLKVIDAAKNLGLKYVSVCNQSEDQWMPNLLEYFTAEELTTLADYSDERGIILCDGRPVDPVYTASTSAQRIQSVFTTLSVDILKMGMWLCLDALSARRVWQELQNNPHIPERMSLMPIGIVEPFSAFVDNRDRNKTPRPILDPFKKIQFMIEEAKVLGSPSLLTDTRHKSRWVLLGSVDKDLPPHIRESIGAIPLIGRKKFMACERLARDAGILLGQAGSIEADQIFWIMSDTTKDAAYDRKNPATAIWTAETERVLRKSDGSSLKGDLQSQRRAAIMPYLSVTNRAMESHAKLNGWLEYLESNGKGNENLRISLIDQHNALSSLQDRYLEIQSRLGKTLDEDDPKDLDAYKNAWEAYRSAFCEYHGVIKENFKWVRDKVAETWSSNK